MLSSLFSVLEQLILPSILCSSCFSKVCFLALNCEPQVVSAVIMESDPIEPSLIAMDSCFTAFDKDW